jgi:hypothetical protein
VGHTNQTPAKRPRGKNAKYAKPEEAAHALRFVRAISRAVTYELQVPRRLRVVAKSQTVAEVWEQITTLRGGGELLRFWADHTCRILDNRRDSRKKWHWRPPFREKLPTNLADAFRVATALRLTTPNAYTRLAGGRCFVLTTPGGLVYFSAKVAQSSTPKSGVLEFIQLQLLPVAPGPAPR